MWVLGVAVCGMSGLFVSSQLINGEPLEWPAILGALLFAGMGAVIIAEALRVRHEVGYDGISYRGLWRRYDRVVWSEFESVKYRHGSIKWLVITTRDGRVMRFSSYLTGMDALARYLRLQLPMLETDAGTEKFLSAWAGRT
jgi:putative Mn2+ efflux pump MntP